MYEDFYQLESLPFENTADPRMFYASDQHREALAAIEYTIRMRKGIVLVTGDIGAGKTTVGRTMLQRCGDRATIVQLLHGHDTGLELIRHVARTLGLPVGDADDRAGVLERLQRHLLDQAQRGRPVVLFVDEAQTLSDAALEELRLLSNFDTADHRLLQLVLIGQPELRDRIRRPELAALRQRIAMAKQLHPLSVQETTDYIAHRLRAASRDPEQVQVAFADDAVEAIYRATRGIPRLINATCDNCLLLGFVKQERRITAAMARRVQMDMVPSFDEPAHVNVDEPRRPALGLAANF